MPGIVGLLTGMPREWSEARLNKMIESMVHQPSYASGTWVDVVSGVYAGWVARKNSFSEEMPLYNEDGNIVLIFSGEEYPEPGAIQALADRGHKLAPVRPSYLVHMYEEDENFLVGLNGRFHGIAIDRSHDKATLFNDRYGVHRLYYHQSKEAFYFAAEAKAILAVCPELRVPDPKSLGEFASCGCVLENRTLFKGISVLPPASTYRFRKGCLKEKSSYFQPADWENQEPLEPEAYYRELLDAFSHKLARYFNGAERIGMSLTGGLDTRMIMAWQRAAEGSLPCYSFGGTIHECEDVRLARKVARQCGQPFEVILVGDDFLSHFSQYAERAIYLTDGCVSVSRAADLYANERAAKIAPVRMTGNYGSEILRTLRAFKPVDPVTGLYHSDFISSVRQARNTYAEQTRGHALSFIAFRQMPWHHYGLLALEETQLTLRSPYIDNAIVRTAFRARDAATPKTDVFKNSKDCSRLIADGNPILSRLRTDRGLGENAETLTGTFERAWLEFTFKAEYAYDYGMPQWVSRADHFVSWLHLERLFLGRHKFNHYRIWYRDALSGYVRDLLLDSRALARPYVDRSGVEAVVMGHLDEGRNYTTEIHQLLTLELVHRLFFDSN